jgi:hypothetical protein
MRQNVDFCLQLAMKDGGFALLSLTQVQLIAWEDGEIIRQKTAVLNAEAVQEEFRTGVRKETGTSTLREKGRQ